MPQSRLSKESEKRLTDALEKAASFIAQGEHPNDALIKSATDAQIPAGHVRLMVNAVNTSCTNAHRLNHDDPLEKAGEFPLADPEVILKAIFPDEVKTKSATYLENIVSSEYTTRPRWLEEKKAREKRAAKVDWSLTGKKLVPETDPDLPIKKAFTTIQKLHNAVEEKRRKVAENREAAIKLAEDLRLYFKRPAHISYKEVKENSEMLFGKTASVILKIADPGKDIYGRTESTSVDINKPPYSLVAKAIKLAAEFKISQTAYTEAVKTANHEANSLLRPFVPGPKSGRSVMAVQLSKTDLEKTGTLGAFLARGLGMFNAADIAREVARRVPGAPQTAGALEERDIQGLMDPAHESEIRNIQAEALLNDLMANDEVIRGYDPEDVIDSFNEVSQLTPYAANKKAIMRDLLRKRLAGGGQALDQFTIGDTLKSQQSLQDLSLPKSENMSVLSNLGVIPHVNGASKGPSVAQ